MTSIVVEIDALRDQLRISARSGKQQPITGDIRDRFNTLLETTLATYGCLDVLAGFPYVHATCTVGELFLATGMLRAAVLVAMEEEDRQKAIIQPQRGARQEG